MNQNSVFHELSSSLSEAERLELLKKISKSIHVASELEDRVYHKDISKEEREVLISQDMNRISLFRRFLIWLSSVFSGKNAREAFLAFKLKDLKRSIQRISPGVSGFETRNLTAACADAFWGLYQLCVPVREIFRDIFSDPQRLEHALFAAVDLKIPEPKKILTDILSIDEMVGLFGRDGQKEGLKAEILNRISQYVDDLPEAVFSETEDDVLPLYFIRDLIQFPFAAFFHLFKYTLVPGEEAEKPLFQNASAMLALSYLEKMHYAVYTALKVKEKFSIDEDFIACFPFSEGTEAAEKRYESLVENLHRLIVKVREFSQTMPLADLIRYFAKDPYYKLMLTVPHLYLKDFFISELKIRFLHELDTYIPEIRKRYIKGEIEKLFKNRGFINFQNYREYTSVDFRKLGLPTFAHIQSLGVLYNYIRYYYREFHQEAVKILEKGVFNQNRIAKDRLTMYSGGFEDIQEKIKAFDFSLSSDSDDGKLFQKLRFSIATDASLQKTYQSLILQKDKQAKSLLTRGSECVAGLRKVFADVLSATGDDVAAQLKTNFFLDTKMQPLSSILKNRVEHLDSFDMLLRQLMKIEQA